MCAASFSETWNLPVGVCMPLLAVETAEVIKIWLPFTSQADWLRILTMTRTSARADPKKLTITRAVKRSLFIKKPSGAFKHRARPRLKGYRERDMLLGPPTIFTGLHCTYPEDRQKCN